MKISMLAEDCANSGGSVDQKLWFVKFQSIGKNIQPVEKIMFNRLGKNSDLF